MKRNDWLDLLSEVNVTCKKAKIDLKSRSLGRKQTTIFTSNAQRKKELVPFAYRTNRTVDQAPMFLVINDKK
tara:strand:+ start:835 stop:1050 length:216 start_codon:yes stop_codon:yes gene_type:complete